MSDEDLNVYLVDAQTVPTKPPKVIDLTKKTARFTLAGKPVDDAAFLAALVKGITNLTGVPAERMEASLEGPQPNPPTTPTPTPDPEPTPTPVEPTPTPEEPTPTPEQPTPTPEEPTPTPAKRANLQAEGDWVAVIFVKPPSANIPLYIIIGVISAVALIITVVLIISLNKKKTSPEYQQIDEEYANDKLMTDTVY